MSDRVDHSAVMRRCLEDCDVETARKLWASTASLMPQPESDQDTLTVIHMARTRARSIRFKLRAYSHAWLRERGLPSGLPDKLRPRAERLYPVVVEAVGIATALKAVTPERLELSQHILRAMSTRVAELYAEGATEPRLVKAEIMIARSNAYKKLMGTTRILKPGE